MGTRARFGPVVAGLAVVLAAASCAAPGAGSDGGSCVETHAYHLRGPYRPAMLVLVDAAPSLRGEAPNVRKDLVDFVSGPFDCPLPGNDFHLAFSTTAHVDGGLVHVPVAPPILDADHLGEKSFLRLASEDLDAALHAGAGPDGLLALERVVARSGIASAGSPLWVLVITDRDDASPGPVATYATELEREAPGVSVRVLGSVDAVGIPARCTDATCAAACTSPDPTGPPCECGGAAPSRRWAALARTVPGSAIQDVCVAMYAGGGICGDVSRISLAHPPAGGDPKRITVTLLQPDGTEVTCSSPGRDRTCADGVDWAYAPGPPTMIDFCDTPGSRCQLRGGTTIQVSVDTCP